VTLSGLAARELDDAVVSRVTSPGGVAQSTQVIVGQSNRTAEFTGSTCTTIVALVERRPRRPPSSIATA
jgi:hypothetical protein